METALLVSVYLLTRMGRKKRVEPCVRLICLVLRAVVQVNRSEMTLPLADLNVHSAGSMCEEGILGDEECGYS
jgi:hypothetical protein